MNPPERDSSCPSCGAPLTSSAATRCTYCGAAFRDASPRTAAPTPPAAPTYNWRRYTYWYVGLIACAVLVSTISARLGSGGSRSRRSPAFHQPPSFTTSNRSAPAPLINSPSFVATLPGGGDLLISTTDDHHQRLARVAPRETRLAWRGELLQSEYAINDDHVAIGTDAVFVADQAQLLALSLADGTTRWKTSLAAEVSSSCPGCVSLSGGKLLVLQKDGSLQAFDPATGSLSWGDKIQPVLRELMVAGDRIVVYRPEAKRRRGGRFAVLDSGSGREQVSFEPSCHSISSFPPERADAYSPRLVGTGGQSMVVLFGNFRFCAQRWNLATGKMAWQVNRPSGFGKLAQSHEKTILLNDDHAVRRLDAETGAFTTLLADDEQNFEPLLLRDDLIVVRATPTWDSSSKKLIVRGLAPGDGHRLWQFSAPEALGLTGARHEDVWQVIDGARGIIVARMVSGETLVYDTLDRLTGVSLEHHSVTFSWRAWRLIPAHGLLWTHVAGGLAGVDLDDGSGRIAYHVP